MLCYVQKILLPYISKKKEELRLQDNQHALVIYDQFKGQVTVRVFKIDAAFSKTLPSLGRNSETNANAEDLNANAEGLNANAEDT